MIAFILIVGAPLAVAYGVVALDDRLRDRRTRAAVVARLNREARS